MRRSANSMYEQGTELSMPSANWKATESATVELCKRRPSGLTENEIDTQYKLSTHTSNMLMWKPLNRQESNLL